MTPKVTVTTHDDGNHNVYIRQQGGQIVVCLLFDLDEIEQFASGLLEYVKVERELARRAEAKEQ